MSIEEETDMAGNSQCPPDGFFPTRRNLQRPPEFFQQPQQMISSSRRHEELPPQWLSPLPPMMPLMISRTEAYEQPLQPPPQWISSRRHGEAEAHEQPPQKRPRPASDPSTQLQTIFFKTRPCRMFEDGNCPHGLNCTFAHGPEDLRQPPPNWQEIVAKEQSQLWQLGYQHQHRPKICKRFYNGERCQYGDRCTFLHIRPNASKNNESQQGFGKSKPCHKYEKHGHCPNGDRCPYAHGSADADAGGSNPKAGPPAEQARDPPKSETAAVQEQEGRQDKRLSKWKWPKKLSRIYGDWIDDL